MKVKLLSLSDSFVTLWTVAYQAPLSMGFSRQDYWSGLPFPSPSYSSPFIYSPCNPLEWFISWHWLVSSHTVLCKIIKGNPLSIQRLFSLCSFLSKTLPTNSCPWTSQDSQVSLLIMGNLLSFTWVPPSLLWDCENFLSAVSWNDHRVFSVLQGSMSFTLLRSKSLKNIVSYILRAFSVVLRENKSSAYYPSWPKVKVWGSLLLSVLVAAFLSCYLASLSARLHTFFQHM